VLRYQAVSDWRSECRNHHNVWCIPYETVCSGLQADLRTFRTIEIISAATCNSRETADGLV
jgi:hypothetical protein